MHNDLVHGCHGDVHRKMTVAEIEVIAHSSRYIGGCKTESRCRVVIGSECSGLEMGRGDIVEGQPKREHGRIINA